MKVLKAMACSWCASLFLCLTVHADLLSVTTNFPGGSGDIDRIDQNSRTIHITTEDTQGRGWACWWYVKVDGLEAGEIFELEVGLSEAYRDRFQKALRGRWATPDRATISFNGKNWNQSEEGSRDDARISYRIKSLGPTCYLAWGPPYLPSDVRTLANDLRKNSFVRSFKLCTTREGRPVDALVISDPSIESAAKKVIWVQARQHAWESGSSWVGDGFARWIAGTDEAAVQIRREAEVFIVPIMDVDNVVEGFGGKNGTPHDHNRDWSDAPHWPSVKAAQEHIRKANEQVRFSVFLDLHNPGPTNDRPFFYSFPRDQMKEERRLRVNRFLEFSRESIVTPLELLKEPQEAGPGYAPMWETISGTWVTLKSPPTAIALCLETSWNTPWSGPDGYRTVGAQLGQAVARYLHAEFDGR
jgi:hypothetical protein